MRMSTKFIVVGTLASLLSCSQPGSGPTAVLEPTLIPAESYVWIEKYAYVTEGDTLYTILSRCNCVDTIVLGTMITNPFHYAISGDTLRLENFRVKHFGQNNSLLRIYGVYERSAAGSGILGTWKHVSMYFTADPALSSADSAKANQEVTYRTLRKYGWMEFRVAEVLCYSQADTTQVGFFSDFKREWSDSLTRSYAVTMDSLSRNELRLTGQTSLEEIMIQRIEETKDVVFTSSVPGHSHTYYHDGQACPNPEYPDWFFAFLEANKLPGLIQ